MKSELLPYKGSLIALSSNEPKNVLKAILNPLKLFKNNGLSVW
ncbi:MAG: hypothetical protein PHR87_14065 [Sulfurospirillaceae bacterium]|jgi:hypothetical protein|nr:hypothetical protein [Sulfurospirillaceae bacterium]